jgi:hypothetical protein
MSTPKQNGGGILGGIAVKFLYRQDSAISSLSKKARTLQRGIPAIN